MPDRVEPPVLLSRLLTFVFATALVVLGALGITLWNMFPLDRPQVFFLTTQIRPEMDVQLYSPNPKNTAQNVETYVASFIKEYIKARNEIVQNANVMQRKWANGTDGVVNMWSTPDVYGEFVNTAMWNTMMYADVNIDMKCTVEFANAPTAITHDKKRWSVTFNYVCTFNDGHTTNKDYTIIVELDKDVQETKEDIKIKWGERLNNPLGIRISSYMVETGGGDPLNFE